LSSAPLTKSLVSLYIYFQVSSQKDTNVRSIACFTLGFWLIQRECVELSAGIVFFIIRWWDPRTFSHHSPDETGPWPAWPLLESNQSLWTWLFLVPLFVYCVWQMLYFLVVNVLRHQRLLRDPEVMTSYRSCSLALPF
jgi:hypothetical protein